MTPAEFRTMMRDRCNAVGGINAFARLHKFTAGHISRVVRGEKPPGERLLKVFGLVAVTSYEPKRSRSKFADAPELPTWNRGA